MLPITARGALGQYYPFSFLKKNDSTALQSRQRRLKDPFQEIPEGENEDSIADLSVSQPGEHNVSSPDLLFVSPDKIVHNVGTPKNRTPYLIDKIIGAKRRNAIFPIWKRFSGESCRKPSRIRSPALYPLSYGRAYHKAIF